VQNKLELVLSNSFDPYFNLALEEELFNHIEENKITLFLWQNENTVVIGRNQNAYKECDYALLKKDGGKLARRLSGGGAVYHDLGNLNFTILSKSVLFDIHKNLKVITSALEKFNIKAEFSGRNDILVNGLKFSGNAYYYDEDRCCHHGTILISSDLNKLTKYLTVSENKLKWKGIDSVRARVTNLIEINPNVNVKEIKEALINSFYKVFQGEICKKPLVFKDDLTLDNLIKKYSSFDFIFGQNPSFDISITKKYDFGELDINLSLKDGIISDIVIYTDALDVQFINVLKQNLRGKIFHEEMIDALVKKGRMLK